MIPPALAVFLVFALLVALLWVARRKGFAALSLRWSGLGTGGPERKMRVVERVSLSGPHSLHLVECAGRWLLVAVSPNGCSALAEFPEPPGESRSAVGAAR